MGEETMKVLHCGDVMPGCSTVITGKDSEEVLEKAEAHARKEHNTMLFPPTVVTQIERAIREEDAGRAR
jgi:predicted small metal-binding protein